ncbi:hypothetical protein N7523_000276 [Penicillium sp. IBT 18751x]|nr:hypothetical protein N7523_000276 [Penicillium sp. IBT 18751x]
MLSSLWAYTSIVTAVTAATLQVNYYSDGGCSDYLTEIYPSTDGTCYGYDWTGMNSANIARCTFPNGDCYCTFYTQANCKGAAQTVSYPNDNCASNYGHGFVSMKCAIIHAI